MWKALAFYYICRQTFKCKKIRLGTDAKTDLCSGDTALKNNAKKRTTNMTIIKEILGDGLYQQFEAAVNAYNCDEAWVLFRILKFFRVI